MSWDFFDKIYCISLKERTDRQENARAQFEKVGLASRVEFFLAEKPLFHSEQGIYESHMQCIQKGIEENAQTILVFEDDILFDRFSPALLRNIVDFLQQENSWNIFFLGCMVNGIKTTTYPSVTHVKYRCSAHAYVLNRPFAEQLVKLPWQGTAFDDLLREMNDNRAYAATPCFAFQSSSPTDNKATQRLARFRELCGGVKLIQKANEFYYLNRSTIWVGHILIILLLILLFLKL